MSATAVEAVIEALDGIDAEGAPPCRARWVAKLLLRGRLRASWPGLRCGLPSAVRMSVTCTACGYRSLAFLCAGHARRYRSGKRVGCPRCHAVGTSRAAES